MTREASRPLPSIRRLTQFILKQQIAGNGARRKELALGRRLDRKAEKERKKSGPLRATPGEARSRLLDYSKKMGVCMRAWVEDQIAGKNAKRLCGLYFRGGECPQKKCKFSHDAGLAKPLLAAANQGGCSLSPSLPPMVLMDLHEVDAGGKLAYDKTVRTQRRTKSLLCFVELEEECVFDFENPTVFSEFVESIRVKVPAWEEEEGGDGESYEEERGETEDEEGEKEETPACRK